MNIEDAGAYLCVSKRSVRRIIARREIQFYRVGTAIRLDRADLDAYLQNRRMKTR
jgi:excisionase family DNA binding protein